MKRAAAAIPLFLGACAIEPMVWVHPAHNDPMQFDRDRAQCEYEANLGTASYSTGPTARTRSGAIAQGLGEGLTIAMRQVELMQLCIRARGYVRVPASQAVALQRPAPGPTGYVPPPPPPPPDGATPPPPPPPTVAAPPPPAAVAASVQEPPAGRWAYHAERLARFDGCDQARPILTYSSARTETYQIVCASRAPITMRCEYADCKSVR